MLAISAVAAIVLPATANAAPYRLLNAITCTSPKFCVAVGLSNFRPFIVQFNGAGWKVMPSPSVGKGNLQGVACATPKSCFAVGYRDSATKHTTLIERWDGKTWRVMPSVSPKGSSELTSVSCPTTSFCAAAGSTQTEDGITMLVEHWRGHIWNVVPTPQLSKFDNENPLNGISCASERFCAAVGSSYHNATSFAMVVQWNGQAWSVAHRQRAAPGPNVLGGVSCPSAKACMAVGHSLGDPPTPVLRDRWDGSSWKLTGGKLLSNRHQTKDLHAVSCVSATACLAVGARDYEYGHAEYWDGSTWTRAKGLVPYSPLSGVACTAPRNCFAVAGNGVARWRDGTWETQAGF